MGEQRGSGLGAALNAAALKVAPERRATLAASRQGLAASGFHEVPGLGSGAHSDRPVKDPLPVIDVVSESPPRQAGAPDAASVWSTRRLTIA